MYVLVARPHAPKIGVRARPHAPKIGGYLKSSSSADHNALAETPSTDRNALADNERIEVPDDEQARRHHRNVCSTARPARP